jgi:hypothetical protein
MASPPLYIYICIMFASRAKTKLGTGELKNEIGHVTHCESTIISKFVIYMDRVVVSTAYHLRNATDFLIVGGDFNAVVNSKDSLGNSNYSHTL